MSHISLKFIFFIALLLCICESQRGGGSRSSGGSRSRSSYRSHRHGNGTSSSEPMTGTDWGILGIFGAFFGGAVILGIKSEQKRKAQRAKKIQAIFTNYEGQSEANACTLDTTQMQKLKDWFMSNKWNISFQTNNGTFRDTAVVILKDIQPKSTYSYKFSMTMKDSIGDSKAEGILTHQADYFGVIFEKTYNNRQAAGQTGNFDLLLYQGMQQGNIFKGQWYYNGYQGDGQYSGTWQMFHTEK